VKHFGRVLATRAAAGDRGGSLSIAPAGARGMGTHPGRSRDDGAIVPSQTIASFRAAGWPLGGDVQEVVV
jgi:hypothetical protein